MISTNMKGLNSIMTFVTSPKAPKANDDSSMMNFGDVMTKAESKNQNDVTKGSSESLNSKPEKTDAKNQMDEGKSKAVEIKKDVNETTDNIQKVDDTEAISDESVSALEDATKDVIKNIADMFEVSEEDVINAMEVLNLSAISLLDPANLNDLVLELSGENDPMTLVTNEELFNTLNDLTTMVDATVADLAKDMDIEVSDVENMINMLASNEDMEMSVDANSGEDTIKEPTPKFTVSVENNGKTSEIKTDDKGNAIETISTVDTSENEVTNKEVNDQDAKGNENKSEEDGQKEQGISFKNPILENQIDNINETSTENVETPFVSEQTTEIMDQILDHMKVRLSEDVNELEMQLHPASLGNVKVNLVSKGGEVTAEFKVQNEMVKAAIENSLNELRENFTNQGTKVTAIEVSVEMQSFDSNLWKGKEEDQTNGQPEKKRQRRLNIDNLDALFEDEATDEEILAAEMLKATGGTVDYTA